MKGGFQGGQSQISLSVCTNECEDYTCRHSLYVFGPGATVGFTGLEKKRMEGKAREKQTPTQALPETNSPILVEHDESESASQHPYDFRVGRGGFLKL